MLPRWLAFIKGLVDSDDLPLNVSRETLQNHHLLKSIKKKLIAKGVELITQLSKDAEKFEKFLAEYVVALKLGAIEDFKYRKKILPLLRFRSSFGEKVGTFFCT
jgi:heat shock protein beta